MLAVSGSETALTPLYDCFSLLNMATCIALTAPLFVDAVL
jgi:hypothetical protein